MLPSAPSLPPSTRVASRRATGRPVREDDAVSGEFRDRKSVMFMGLRSVLCFPFAVGDDVGFVYVDDHTVRGAFDEDALRAMEVWIPLLASCLSHAHPG